MELNLLKIVRKLGYQVRELLGYYGYQKEAQDKEKGKEQYYHQGSRNPSFDSLFFQKGKKRV